MDNDELSILEMQEDETPVAHAAFRDYLMLGVKRSFPKLAAKLGLSTQAIEGWSVKFKWSDRVRVYEKHLTQNFVSSRMDLIKQNRDRITLDIIQDYNLMLEVWRDKFDKVDDDTSYKDFKDLIISRIMINDVARTAVGLPKSVRGEAEETKAQLPANVPIGLASRSSDDAEA